MSKLVFLLFLAIFFGGAVAKITNTTLVSLPEYSTAAFVFYYSGQIVVGLNVFNGPNTGMSPSLAVYSLEGTMQSTLELPVKCTIMYCNAQLYFIALDGSMLTLQATPDGIAALHYQFISVNLDTLEVVQQISPPANLYITSYLSQLNSSTVVFNSVSSSGSGAAAFGALALDTLTPTVVEPIDFPYLIPANTIALADMMYVCASEPSHRYNPTFISVSFPSLTVGNDTECNCKGFAEYQSSFSQIAWVNTTARDLTLEFYGVGKKTDGLVLYPGMTTLGEDAYATNLAASDNYVFATGRLWSNQSEGYIYQASTGWGQATLLDSVKIPESYLAGGPAAIDEESMTYTVFCLPQLANMPAALVILDFDDN